MIGQSGTQLLPGRHQVCRTAFQAFLDRDPSVRACRQDLVSVWDNHRKTFSVGVWANRLSGRFISIVSWRPPAEPGPDDLLTVLFNLDPDRRRRHITGFLDQLAADDRRNARQIADDAAEEHRLREHLRRKIPGMSRKDPTLLAMPIFPGRAP